MQREVYNPSVPNKRSAEQELIAFALKRDLLMAADEQAQHEGKDRSRYIREALIEDLNSKGWNLPMELALAPGRTRKNRTAGQTKASVRYKLTQPETSLVAEGDGEMDKAVKAEADRVEAEIRAQLDAEMKQKPTPKRVRSK